MADIPAATTLVVVPTYNERDNLPLIVNRLRTAQPHIHILIVDDSSPDGTGHLADHLAATDPALSVLHRTIKNGLGMAYLDAFTWALDRDYQHIVEMDADGSHAPEQLQHLLDAITAGADLAIGSRYVPGGEIHNWPWRRHVLSGLANRYARLMLGTSLRDITAGYRVYRRTVLEHIDLPAVDSRGYCFQIDLALRTLNAGYTVVEVPITFVERQHGTSKVSSSNIWEATRSIARWRRHGLPGTAKLPTRQTIPPN